MKKICVTCKKNKSVSEFYKHNKKGYQNQCKLCRSDYNKVHYKKNKEKYLESAIKYKNKYRAWWNKYKSSLKCTDCEENHPATLDFHHISDDKEAEISKLISNQAPKERVFKEIKKCIVLCANCHRKLHWRKNNNG